MAKFTLGTYKTVKIRSYLDVQEEHKAAVADLLPGMFVTYGAVANGAFPVTNVGTSGTLSTPLFVVTEDELQGKTILDKYAKDDPIQCWMAMRGDIVLAHVAVSQTIAAGGKVTLDAAGSIIALPSTGTPQALGVALTAITTTASAANTDYVMVLIG